MPANVITGVQLCDPTLRVPAERSLLDDCFDHRLLPGDGEFPIAEIVDILRGIGGLSRVGLEIFSSEFDRRSADVGRKIGGSCAGTPTPRPTGIALTIRARVGVPA